MKQVICTVPALLLCLLSFAQNVGINTATPAHPLDITGVATAPITVRITDNITGSARLGFNASINSSTGNSAAVVGTTYEGSGVAALESVTYGLLGRSGLAGYAVAGYSLASTALRGSSGTGLALHTSGSLRLNDIGEGAGKVLTSDAAGNATWVAPTVGPHDHFGESWGGPESNGLTIVNNNAGGAAFRASVGNSGTNYGITAASSSPNGFGIFAYNNSSGSYHPANSNTAIAGVAGNGTGLFGASLTGLSVYGLKSNFGIAAGPVAKFSNLKTGITDAVVIIEAVQGQPALELNNGPIKVSGTNRAAYKHASAAANIVANRTNLNYEGQDPADILIVNHNYNTGPGSGGTYLNKSFGVWWNGTNWTIYLEDLSAFPAGVTFNVLIIKQ